MKVKKYVAPTMPEAMNKIRKELGPDAVILSSKEIQEGGFLGFFKKRKIEVIAALDKKSISVKQSTGKSKNANADSSRRSLVDDKLIQEMKTMRKILEKQSIQQSPYKFQLDYQLIYQHLLDQEVEEELAAKLVENVVQKHEAANVSPNSETIRQDMKLEIEEKLNRLSFEGISESAKVVHFLGPTGVGKTTTLAKVAANKVLKDKKKVAFITMDTYRIAAIDQLKTYAKILDIPVEVVYSVEDYQAAINKLEHYDLILVDTAGRNYRDEQYVKELEKNMRTSMDVENYLVLSLTSKPKDISDIYDNFRHIHIKSLIFTKIDETRQYGSMINIPLIHQKGIAYLTNGQEVPDNILKPTSKIISNLIVGDSNDI